jgi:hypothetical protein
MKHSGVSKRTAFFIAVSTVFFLSACAGGGGGGAAGSGGTGGPSASDIINNPPSAPSPPNTTPAPPTTTVPYATPVRVGSVTPINSTTYEYDSSAMFAANLTGNGQSLIMAGRSSTALGGSYPSYNLNIFDWENGQLVNKTSKWFAGTSNVVLGTEPSVKFGDFNGSGRQSMYVAPNTDNSLSGSGWLFLNNGSSFTRVDLNLGINGHDSAVYDINRDGVDDIFTTGSKVVFGSRTNTFISHTVSGTDYGGSAGSVAIADFMGTGGSTVILTDQNSFQSGGTKLYSWAMTDGGRATRDFELTKISTLPSSRFFLPKWASNGFTGSHEYRSLAFDFDNSGTPSAVIFSRPVQAQGGGVHLWPDFSEIQFLKNKGGGVFIDVTDTTLVGYNTKTPANYNPTLADVNGDGLIDIVLASTSWNTNSGAQVLIHTKEHKYVASYAEVIDAFVGQATNIEKAINASAQNGANGIVFIKGPDGNMYLGTAVSYSGNGVQQKALYLSKLGAATTTTQATINSIKQTWPWMSEAQVNTVLAASSTNFFGFNLLDPSKAMQPVGDVSILLSGNRGFVPIRGYVMGLGLDDASAVVTDSVGRGFTTNLKFMNVAGINGFGYNTEHIDQHNLTSHAEYLVNGSPITVGNMRVASESRNAFFGNDQGPGQLQKPTQYSVGVPEVYKKGKFTYGAQYTNLNSNPWMAFGGAWGSINNSGIMDNVVTYRDGGFSTQASLMHVTTNITPGLITKVNNMVGTWAESGYRFGDIKDKGDIGVYAGVKPMVLSGNVEAKIPSSVDNSGNVVYTNKKLAVQNQVTPYLRALYTNLIDKKTMYRFSVIGTQQGQFRLMNELRFWID